MTEVEWARALMGLAVFGLGYLAGWVHGLNQGGQCKHEWTYWKPLADGGGWTRTCTKCGDLGASVVLTDEIRDQT